MIENEHVMTLKPFSGHPAKWHLEVVDTKFIDRLWSWLDIKKQELKWRDAGIDGNAIINGTKFKIV